MEPRRPLVARIPPALLVCALATACSHDVEIVPEPPNETFPTITAAVTTPPALPRVMPALDPPAGVARSEPILPPPLPTPRPRGARCEIGQTVSCFTPPVSMCHGATDETRSCRVLVKTCQQLPDGRVGFDESACNTPLVVSFHEDEPVEFTQPPGAFSIGDSTRTEWVSARTPWLGRDLDGSGCIEGQRELFGPAEDGLGNGFYNLARFDDSGDGRIDQADKIFPELLLWTDTNQDRRCTKDEVTSLETAGIVALDVEDRSFPVQRSGSYEGEQAPLWFRTAPGEAPRKGRLIDVYLLPLR